MFSSISTKSTETAVTGPPQASALKPMLLPHCGPPRSDGAILFYRAGRVEHMRTDRRLQSLLQTQRELTTLVKLSSQLGSDAIVRQQ